MSNGSGIPILHLNETAVQRAQRHVNSAVHSSLAEIVLAGIRGDGLDEPLTATAYCRRSGLRMVVRLVRYAGRAYEPVPEMCPLTPTQRKILAMCDRQTSRPAKWIARRLGRSGVDSYLRQLLRELVRKTRLKRHGGGYLLA